MKSHEVTLDANIHLNMRNRLQFICSRLGIQTSSIGSQVSHLIRRVKDRRLLAHQYKNISLALSKKFPLATERTSHERWFQRRFHAATKVWVYPQTWIGNTCSDLYIPAFGIRKTNNQRGFQYRGVSVEIDGSIHQRTFKAQKDHYKDSLLESLGIAVIRIPNEHVERYFIPTHKADARISILDSRARQRVWAAVHLSTLIAHAAPETILSLFEAKYHVKLGGLK